MIDEDNIFRVHKEQEQKQEQDSISPPMIINPGSAYLRCLQYYSEEKEISSQNEPAKLLLWEKFVSKYFTANIDLSVRILEKDNLFYELSNHFLNLDCDFNNLAYVYLHKNKIIFNKWIFLYNYNETIEKDENNNFYKVITFRNVMNVLQYKKYKIFLNFDCACILNSELKYEKVHVIINNIELFDEVKSKNLNSLEFKNQIFDIYIAFNNFMEGIKRLISDFNFLNDFLD